MLDVEALTNTYLRTVVPESTRVTSTSGGNVLERPVVHTAALSARDHITNADVRGLAVPVAVTISGVGRDRTWGLVELVHDAFIRLRSWDNPTDWAPDLVEVSGPTKVGTVETPSGATVHSWSATYTLLVFELPER